MHHVMHHAMHPKHILFIHHVMHHALHSKHILFMHHSSPVHRYAIPFRCELHNGECGVTLLESLSMSYLCLRLHLGTGDW